MQLLRARALLQHRLHLSPLQGWVGKVFLTFSTLNLGNPTTPTLSLSISFSPSLSLNPRPPPRQDGAEGIEP